MEDKSYLMFAKRKKKRVNGKINKEKLKKSFLKNEKYVRVSTLNRNISKKTFLHTLFKSFIKPYNEKNTAFYSILCIINNIYKCHYFTKHRCLICKPLHERTLKSQEDNVTYNSSDGDDNYLFPYNIYYNLKKINLIESGKTKNNSNNNKYQVIDKSNDISLSHNVTGKLIQKNEKECGFEKNTEEIEKEKKKVLTEENKNKEGENEERDIIYQERKNIVLSESVKLNALNNKTKLNVNIIKKNITINETQVSNTCPVQNFLNTRINLTNVQQYHFLSHDKINYVDLYNFDIFDKINIYDKILLDLNQNEIHPNVLRTGIFFNKYINTTHNHRNVDLLVALKSFIKDYTLPPYEPINRHMKVVIDKEINYIIMCKKHSISMGEVIRWFKNMISEHIGKSILEETKVIITNNINNYIRTKIVIPSIIISNYVSENIIHDSDILLIYTFDYDIYLSIVKARKKGKNFEIILVDSEPYKNSYNIKLYTKLGIPVTYTLISGLFYNIKRCTKVLLGIDAIIHNSVYGYVGTSIICMMSNINNIYVYIVCETYKISNKIIIDSFSLNNINNNLDIYDYIYMHHYHHATPHKCASQRDKQEDHGLMFSKKLNTFIESYADIKSNSVLFSKNGVENRSSCYSSSGNRCSNNSSSVCGKPIITYCVSQLKRANSSQNGSKFTSTQKKEQTVTCEDQPTEKFQGNEMNIGYEKNTEQYSSNSCYSLHIKTSTEHESSNNVLKSVSTVEEKNTSFFMNSYKEEKRENSILKDGLYEKLNIYKMNEEESNIEEKKGNTFSLSHIKEVSNNSSSIISTKGILKQPISVFRDIKNESTNISITYKQSCANLLNDDNKNVNKNNKVFSNLKSDKNYCEKSKYSLNFRNSININTMPNNLNKRTEYNKLEEDKICCNNICNSICNSIGHMNIKNVCTDNYIETNLFSSVLSHINKINSNTDKSFYVANICNDVTPLKYISYIVTEVGVYTNENKNALNVFMQNNI
ncbi:translation initiation factor eIF-2B subunit delta [Plasmodium brasilianum]|uniref:Translation initiation factor eIF2B subunit delta n=2 Tax=Plasmodium (Plasmodium) TaxID=418103 RepID=A0A1A8VXN6_PLAMA|nr:translation initiation factor eIF-2B subunit delta, putative [Plasmodium malariae]KAI4838833.1 translation initiation factor eIF-2B subunit delta [Plasmodium brasilianum]SBS84472.1 initiation factor 2 subunit family [Plasmodium malariae]SCN12174.1 translation initiation factor eIF-2B subunit delta, putative [Plasmodium malariae]